MNNEHSQAALPNPIKERIDSGGLSLTQIMVVATCFVLNMLDGFDIVAMSTAAPILLAEWGNSDAQTGYILSAALLGMTLGAMFLAPLCDRYGRRSMMLLATGFTGACMLLTTVVPPSVEVLIVVRILTGLGIGVIMANTTSLTTEFAPERWRNFLVPLVVLGYPFGAMSVGPITELLLPDYGWRGVFYFGGYFSLVVMCMMLVLLPESISFLAAQKGRDALRLKMINKILRRIKQAPFDSLPAIDTTVRAASVGALLAPVYRANTIKLWIMSFCSLLTMYFFFAWLPLLFVKSGFARSDGSYALTLFSFGGVVGILILGIVTSRVSLLKFVSRFYILSAAFMFCYALLASGDLDLVVLYALIFVIGLLFQGAYTGIYTASSRAYPPLIRATGVGWAIGLGRTGAIIAPTMVGYFVAFGWTVPDLFVFFAVPVLLAGILGATLKLGANV